MKRRTFIKRIGLLFAAVIVPKSLVEHTIKDRAKSLSLSTSSSGEASSSSSKSSWSTSSRSTSTRFPPSRGILGRIDGVQFMTEEVWSREMIKAARKPSVWAAMPNTKLTLQRRRM